jgi:cytochrome P450
MVIYSVYSMHRREDLYGPNSNEFWPERWDSIRPGWGYLPFNGGPRICLGQQYALAEAGYVTSGWRSDSVSSRVVIRGSGKRAFR